jgi:phosphohistidine phosphatase
MDEITRLIVLRHAKSAWPGDVDDHERPLGPRGLRDAPRAGRWLRENRYLPDLVVCSTAKRTRETWGLVAAELPEEPPVEYDDVLYGAGFEELLDVARRAPGGVSTLALVGHEPGVSEITLHLAGEDAIDRFPTGAIAVLAVAGGLEAGSGRLEQFFRPRDAG